MNAPGYLFSTPGFGLSVIGVLVLVLTQNGVEVGGTQFGVHTGIGGGLLALAGFQLTLFGALSMVSSDPVRGASDPFMTWFTEHISLERGTAIRSVVLLCGLTYGELLTFAWVMSGFGALSIAVADVVATVAAMIGLQMAFGSFLLGSLRE